MQPLMTSVIQRVCSKGVSHGDLHWFTPDSMHVLLRGVIGVFRLRESFRGELSMTSPVKIPVPPPPPPLLGGTQTGEPQGVVPVECQPVGHPPNGTRCGFEAMRCGRCMTAMFHSIVATHEAKLKQHEAPRRGRKAQTQEESGEESRDGESVAVGSRGHRGRRCHLLFW